MGCTDDSCDEVNDVVVNAPNDGLCDNGLFCDGSETCDPALDCQAGIPPAIDDGECPADVAGLRALVLSRASDEFADAFGDPNVFCAVNQRVVDDAHPLSASDEVAFFPPMTGG